MTWHDFEPPPEHRDARGSEGGVIVLDHEHADGARTTLERDTLAAPFAVTCGIYGWMVHTRFFSDEARARADVAAMPDALTDILALIPPETEMKKRDKVNVAIDDISTFASRFP